MKAMKYFVQSDGSIIECVTENPKNPENFPIITVDALPAPFIYCKAVPEGNAYKVEAVKDWEETQANEVQKFLEKSIKALVQDFLTRKAVEKGFQSLDSAIILSITQGPYQELGKQFAEFRDRAFKIRDNFLVQALSHESIEACMSELNALDLENIYVT